MDNKEIIYEDVLSEEYLLEMGRVYPISQNKKFDILVGYTPENSTGNPYFKVYDHSSRYQSATKVIRISFLSPTVITGHIERNGKKEWKLENFGNTYREELIEYLNSRSQLNRDISVWTELKFQWNKMKGIEIESMPEYINGDYDINKNMKNPDYVPYNLKMPDYMELQNDKKGK